MSTESLESAIAVKEKDEISDFCQFVLFRHAEQWPVNEVTLAGEFLEFFAVQPLLFLTFEEVARLCRERLQIAASVAPLPGRLKGINISHNGKHEILVSTDQDLAGIADLHTLLHELREIIERGFERRGRATADAN